MDIIKNKKEIYIIPIEIKGLDCNKDKQMIISTNNGFSDIHLGWNYIWNNINYKNLEDIVYFDLIKDYLFLIFDYNGNCLSEKKIIYNFNFYINENINFNKQIEIYIL